MKQTLFMFLALAIGVPSSLLNPFIGLIIYYAFATLYPHYLWEHALPSGVRWSLIIGLATLGGYLFKGMAKNPAGRRWPLEKKLLLLMAFLITLSCIDATDAARAGIQLDSYLKIFLMFFVACGLLDSRYRLHVLAITLVLTLGWLAVDFNQRYVLMGQKRFLADASFGTLDNNGVAALMVIAMPFCVFLFSQEQRWYLKWPPMAAMVLMLHVVLFSMSRAAMLTSLIMLPLLLLRHRPRWLGAAMTVVMLSVGLYLAGPGVRTRFLSIESYERDDSARNRLTAWDASLQIMRDYPVLGVGPDCYRTIVGSYDASLSGRNVHNSFLQAAVDMGIPVGLINLLVPVICMIRLQKLRGRLGQDRFVYSLAGSIQASLVAYMLVGSFSSIGTIELPYVVMVMAIGLENVTETEEPALARLEAQRGRPLWKILEGLKPATT
jgi:probable O-glycosylation ligase (exosortase A-associated)